MKTNMGLNPAYGIFGTLLLFGVSGSVGGLIFPRAAGMDDDNLDVMESQRSLGAFQPNKPDCFNFFPGTPMWNDCLRRFTTDMANYQTQMHDYIRKSPNTGNSLIQRPGHYYSDSSYSSSTTMSTSNNYVGGYAIKAVNMPISTSVVNGIVKVTFRANNIENFETKTEGNEIELNVITRTGQKKWAKIVVPKGVRTNDVKMDRVKDAIYFTAPTRDSFGNFQISSSGNTGSSSSSNSINQNFGQYGNVGLAAPLPSIPSMPDFQSLFQNMFHNMFSMFGGRLPTSSKQQTRYVNPSPEGYAPPFYQSWFY